MNRRAGWNHALRYAAELANRAGLPLLVYEGLTCSYPYASDRLHTFILEGVPDTEQRLRKLGVGYIFYLRRKRSDPDSVLYRLVSEAAALITDDYPTFVARQHNARVPSKLPIPESNGKTRVRRVHHSAEDLQAAAPLPETTPSGSSASQIQFAASGLPHYGQFGEYR
jgi:hypothetical protein